MGSVENNERERGDKRKHEKGHKEAQAWWDMGTTPL
jgi:hypothetical protein